MVSRLIPVSPSLKCNIQKNGFEVHILEYIVSTYYLYVPNFSTTSTIDLVVDRLHTHTQSLIFFFIRNNPRYSAAQWPLDDIWHYFLHNISYSNIFLFLYIYIYILIVYNKFSIYISFTKLSVCLIVYTFGPSDWYRNSGMLCLVLAFSVCLHSTSTYICLIVRWTSHIAHLGCSSLFIS